MGIERVVLIGAGNVGWHLGHALLEAGVVITQVFSRQVEKSAMLAKAIDAEFISNLKEVSPEADLFLLAVQDDAIESVAMQLVDHIGKHALICHTSGATPSNILTKFTKRSGVFYPLQTLSKEKVVNFREIPICITANAKADEEDLFALANRLSSAVFIIDDAQRATLHLAAVFANNFSNHLFTIAQQLLANQNLSLDLLRPLIKETAAKIQVHDPGSMQTGPAVRGDMQTIERHLKALKDYPEFQKIYQLLSLSIQKNN